MTSPRYLGDDVKPGTRVKVVRDPDWDGPWPSEPLGTIALNSEAPKEIIDLAKSPAINVPDSDRGPMRVFFIYFDTPQIDGDGCGPYRASDVWEKYLRPIGEPDHLA